MTEWSRERIILEAQREPERIQFWLPYHRHYLDACRAVVENPPSFDRLWQGLFPSPKEFRAFAALCRGGWVWRRRLAKARQDRRLVRRMGQKRGWRPRNDA